MEATSKARGLTLHSLTRAVTAWLGSPTPKPLATSQGSVDFPSSFPLTISNSGSGTLLTPSSALHQASSQAKNSGQWAQIPPSPSLLESCQFYFLTLPNSSPSLFLRLPFSPEFLQWALKHPSNLKGKVRKYKWDPLLCNIKKSSMASPLSTH